MDSEKAKFDREFDKADYIFAQRVADAYPCTFVRTQYLRENYGHKATIWPNVFYRGYNPELTYVRMAGRHPLRGPLGDYHNQTFLDGWEKGLSIRETLNLHQDIDYNYERYGNIPETSLIELQNREAGCDVKISKFVKEKFRRQRLFFTFNHPRMVLLAYVAEKILEHVGITGNQIDYTRLAEPLGQFIPPVNSWVANQYALLFEDERFWRGARVKQINGSNVTTGKKYLYQDKEIIEVFFKIYSANNAMMRDFFRRN